MQPVTSIDKYNKYSGSFALKMESTNPNVHGRAVQNVQIAIDRRYHFGSFSEQTGILHGNAERRILPHPTGVEAAYHAYKIASTHQDHWNVSATAGWLIFG